MEALFYIISLVVTLQLLITGSEGIKCYACSWSPRENRTDSCSSGRFRQDLASHLECEHGCESVRHLDINGEVESFFRNCAPEMHVQPSDCVKDTTTAYSREICRCNSNLCNSARTRGALASAVTAITMCALALTKYVTHS